MSGERGRSVRPVSPYDVGLPLPPSRRPRDAVSTVMLGCEPDVGVHGPVDQLVEGGAFEKLAKQKPRDIGIGECTVRAVRDDRAERRLRVQRPTFMPAWLTSSAKRTGGGQAGNEADADAAEKAAKILRAR